MGGRAGPASRRPFFSWCFTPELYAARPEYVDSLAEFVHGRPMPPVDAFLRQSGASERLRKRDEQAAGLALILLGAYLITDQLVQ